MAAARPERSFSTLYRVDAIEAEHPKPLFKMRNARFSTLYRVDAIEAANWGGRARGSVSVSVPSIGSMLLKHISPLPLTIS